VGAACAALIALVIVTACEEGTEPTAAGNRPDLAATAVETEGAVAIGSPAAGGVIPQGRIALPINQSIATTAANPAFGVTQTGTGPDGVFKITNAGNAQNALLGQTSGSGSAVRGLATSTGGRAGSFQISNAANGQAALLGETNGTGRGVHGRVTGSGIAGLFTVENPSSAAPAVLASSTGSGIGVVGLNFGTGRGGVFQISNPSSGAIALDVATNGTGRAGTFVISNPNSDATALHAESFGGDAVHGVNRGNGSAGVFSIENANSSEAALFVTTNGIGPAAFFTGRGRGQALMAEGPAQFIGNVRVSGTLTKSGGSFRIDHPLDPEHKYLSHSFVESPDMLNVYDGTAMLDGRGEAVVMLPTYFEALNRDFRYQLTAIGAPGPNLHISQKIRSNRFVIAGGVPGAEVSWQVTGVRQDAYAEAHRIQVETDKPAAARGVALAH
jgi:hypothetical protein